MTKPAAKTRRRPVRGDVILKQMHLSPTAVQRGEAIRKRLSLPSFTSAVERALEFADAHLGPDGQIIKDDDSSTH